MLYHYSKTAGYYGNGAWVVFGHDYMGRTAPYYCLDTEQEASAKGAKPCPGCKICKGPQ